MSLLMDIQTNRCWAGVDFLATGEIVLHIPEECELPIRVLVSRGGRSTEYEPKSSEKPNNCEVKNYCDDCLYTDTCDSKEFFYACTSKATISKMEQVEEPKTQMKTQNSNLTFEKAVEPQTERPSCETCRWDSEEWYDEHCDSCVAHTDKPSNYEPQTDCAWR